MLKKIDLYIIKKFLGTFFFSLVLIMIIVLVFTYSEDADNFQYNNAPTSDIIKYYLVLAPFFAMMFSSTFTFIAVIFFTSHMAVNSEIIGISSSGISFNRMLRPYMISALVIAVFSFILTNFVLPSTNKVKNDIKSKYIRRGGLNKNSNDVHMQLEKGLFIHIGFYSKSKQKAKRVKLQRFTDGGVLTSTLYAKEMLWRPSSAKWTLKQYKLRKIDGLYETISEGKQIDTLINLSPKDFELKVNDADAMTLGRLNEFIKDQERKGTNNVAEYQVKKYERWASPWATFILTIVAVSIASRKVRGGMGLHIGLGLVIAFSYLMLMRISTVIAGAGTIAPLLAVWLPNIIYAVIAFILYRLAPK